MLFFFWGLWHQRWGPGPKSNMDHTLNPNHAGAGQLCGAEEARPSRHAHQEGCEGALSAVGTLEGIATAGASLKAAYFFIYLASVSFRDGCTLRRPGLHWECGALFLPKKNRARQICAFRNNDLQGSLGCPAWLLPASPPASPPLPCVPSHITALNITSVVYACVRPCRMDV